MTWRHFIGNCGQKEFDEKLHMLFKQFGNSSEKNTRKRLDIAILTYITGCTV